MARQKKTETRIIETKKVERPGGWVDFFPRAMDLVAPTSADKKRSNKAVLEKRIEVDPLSGERTLTRITPAGQVETVPAPLPKAKQMVREHRDRLSASRPLTIIAILIFIGSGWMAWKIAGESATPAMSKEGGVVDRLERRAEFHRDSLGKKLNRERINVQFDNLKTAPMLKDGDVKVPAPDMMRGVPLMGEAPNRMNHRDRLIPANPAYPDARVQYGLQEEQAAQAWESEAQELYVREFIENAKRAGYEVGVDRKGNVKVLRRRPTAEDGSRVTLPVDGGDDGSPGAQR